MVIPCCRFELSRPFSGRFKEYLVYLESIMRQCGFHVEYEHLRIPSTKNIAMVGRRRTYSEGPFFALGWLALVVWTMHVTCFVCPLQRMRRPKRAWNTRCMSW